MGEDAELTIELGCTTLLDTVRIKNLAPGRGTTQFSLHISQDQSGPWTQLLTAELTQFKVGFDCKPKVIFNVTTLPKDCDQPANEFNLFNLQRAERTGRYVRILVESYYGAGGGLSHVSFHGKKAANSNKKTPCFLIISIFFTSGHDCTCSVVNDESKCNTLGLDQVREGNAKYWCYVDKDSPCVDMQESSSEQGRYYSFQACASKQSRRANEVLCLKPRVLFLRHG